MPRNPAAVLGRKGGRSTSSAKSAAARANGKLGGRPANQYAILQAGYAFFGVGETEEAAVADARRWTDDGEPHYRDATRGPARELDGELILVRVTPALAEAIEEDGQRALTLSVRRDSGVYALREE